MRKVYEKCELCKFCKNYPDTHKGLCRRYPPTCMVNRYSNANTNDLAVFPLVDKEGWCGEFRGK